MKNPFQKLTFFFCFKNDVNIFLINGYILYSYIHFHVVPNTESVMMLASVVTLRVCLGVNIVLYETVIAILHTLIQLCCTI